MFAFLVVAALAASPYQAHVLHTDLDVTDVAACDANGIGRATVFALCCEPKSDPLRKTLAAFVPDASGVYPGTATYTVELPSTASVLFFAKAGKGSPQTLVAADAQGATLFKMANGQLRQASRIPFTALFPLSAKEPLFRPEFATDLDNDGIDEWLVPLPGGYEIRTETGLRATVSCDMGGDLRNGDSLSISYRLPAVRDFELQGQPHKGVAFLSTNFADFGYGKEWAEHKRFRVPMELDGKWDAFTSMEDINGDKFPDLVITQTRGTINVESSTQVYIASAPFQYPEHPTATFPASGSLAAPFLLDVDGDGARDMVFVKVGFGVRNIVNFFMRRKLSATADVYLYHKTGFGQKPDYTETITLDAPEGKERVAYTLGDFNGDGRIDMAYGAASDRLDIRAGSQAEFLSAKPWASIPIPGFGVARECKLNGNKNADLVMFHPGGTNKTRVDVVVF